MSPAMANGRCRMHGGRALGPPKGSQNALKHGRYTEAAIERRAMVSAMVRMTRRMVAEVCE